MKSNHNKSIRLKGFGVLLLLVCESYFLFAQQPIILWEHAKTGFSKVTLTPFIPTDSNKERTAVIVCPGGSYCWLDHTNERNTVGKWLQQEGYAAFVLLYQTSGFPAYFFHYRFFTSRHQFPAMIQDLQQAIRYLRLHATEFGINPNRIGVMGFSAGGHLALTAAEFSHQDYLKALGIQTEVSLRPDFVAALYPVVTLSDNRYVHKRSRRGLLGEWKKSSRMMRDSLSLEKHISSNLPPIFLANCLDDPTVKYQNSVLLDSALTANRAPHVYYKYKTGGHGFGSNPHSDMESSQWKQDFLEWMKQQSFK